MTIRPSGLSIAAITLLAAGQASAFAVQQTDAGAHVHWPTPLFPVLLAKTGNAAKDALLESAARGAAAAWAARSSILIDVRMAQDSDDARIDFNSVKPNVNVIKFAGENWPYDTEMLAMTALRYDIDSGEILDADILINDVTHAWADRLTGPDAADQYDLQNALTHEIGHALGLGHSDVPRATMYPDTDPRDVAKRFLDGDDIAGAEVLYGHVGNDTGGDLGLATPIEPSVGCTNTSGSDPAILLLLVLSALALLWRRHGAPRRAAVITTTGAVLMAASVVHAGEVDRSPNLAHLLAHADAVVQGTVLDQRVETRDDGMILTVSRIRIDRCVAGECPRTLVLEQLGGETDGIGLAIGGITLVRPGEALVVATRVRGKRWAMVERDRGRLLDLGHAAPTELHALEDRIIRAWRTPTKSRP